MQESGTPCELIQTLGRPLQSLDAKGVEKSRRLGDALKGFLSAQWKAFLREHEEAPVQVFYSCDSTPLSTTDTWKRAWGLVKVLRKQRQSAEYLIQRAFAGNLKGEVVCLLEEPRPMRDKTAWTHFQGFREHASLARSSGHRGVLSHHYCFDRAIWSAMTKRLQQLHRAQEAHLAEIDSAETGARMLNLQELMTSVPCASHDCHNALKWSMSSLARDANAMRNCFILIESVRNGFGLLARYMNAWLREVLVYEDWAYAFGGEQLWALLGLSPEQLDLAAELQIRWDAGRLKVAKQWASKADGIDAIEAFLFNVFTFRKWSESRWLSLGPTCRSLIGSLICGLKPFVDYVVAQPGSSRYFLGGFVDRYAPDIVQMLATVAFSSYPADAALASILTDDRLVLTLPSLDSDVAEEMDYLWRVPRELWEFVAGAVEWRGASLRDAVLRAGVVAVGFLRHRLHYLRGYPWSLCYGDLDDRLNELEAAEEPQEPVAQRIWTMLKMGVARGVLKDALKLLRNSSFSTVQAEEGHVHASVLLRTHKKYSRETLVARALVASARPLVAQSDSHRRVAAARAKVDRASRKKYSHLTGRQLYVRDLIGEGRRQGFAQYGGGRKLSKAVISRHGTTWAQLTVAQRAHYERRASAARADLEHSQAENLAEAQTALRLEVERARNARESDELPPLRMSSCAFSAAQRTAFNSFHASAAKGEALSAKPQGTEIQPPREQLQQVLESMPVSGVYPPTRRGPSWLGMVAMHRDFFTGCLLRVFDGETVSIGMVSFVRQAGPRMLGLVSCEECDLSDSAWEALEIRGECLLDYSFSHLFRIRLGHWSFTDVEQWHDEWSVWYMSHVVCLPGGLVGADGDWKEMQRFAPTEGSATVADEGDESPSEEVEAEADADEPPPWENLPWLLHEDYEMDVQAKRRSAASRSHSSQEFHSEEPEYQQRLELTPEQVLEELYARRAAMDATFVGTDFVHVLRGGQWTAAKTGQAYDSWRGQARAPARRWCLEHSLPQSGTFSIALYGNEQAELLAQAWCWRMQELKMADELSGGDAGLFSAAVDAIDTPAWVTSVAEHGSLHRDKLEQILALRPPPAGSSGVASSSGA